MLDTMVLRTCRAIAAWCAVFSNPPVAPACAPAPLAVMEASKAVMSVPSCVMNVAGNPTLVNCAVNATASQVELFASQAGLFPFAAQLNHHSLARGFHFQC